MSGRGPSSRRTASARRTPRRRRIAAIAGLATAVAGGDAVAQPGDSEFIRDLGCDDELEALANGDKLAASGQYEKARLEFARAWTVLRTPNVLFKLADADQRSGHVVDAIARFGEFMTLTQSDSAYMKALATYESYNPQEIDALRTEASRRLADLQHRRLADGLGSK